MNAAEFNSAYPVGTAVVHDPAPLLGEAAETCTVHAPAFDMPDAGSADPAAILWTGVELRRPNGGVITAQLEHLRL